MAYSMRVVSQICHNWELLHTGLVNNILQYISWTIECRSRNIRWCNWLQTLWFCRVKIELEMNQRICFYACMKWNQLLLKTLVNYYVIIIWNQIFNYIQSRKRGCLLEIYIEEAKSQKTTLNPTQIRKLKLVFASNQEFHHSSKHIHLQFQ